MDLPEGTRDLLPTDLIRQERLRRLMLDVFRSWGYQTVLPPSLERLETLKKGRPQLTEKAFKVVDSDGGFLVLRPDLTMPIARLAATRLSSLERPLRLCYAAVVFRQGENLPDSRKEIYQGGIELIGCSNKEEAFSLEQISKSNLECMSIFLETLEELQIPDYKIVLTHSDLWKYAGEVFHRIEEYLEIEIHEELDAILKKGDFIEYKKFIDKIEDRCEKMLTQPCELKSIFETNKNERPLDYLKRACFKLTGKPSDVLSYLDSDSDLYAELKSIVELEEIFGKDKFIIDFTLRPDTSFYTGLYFELVVPGNGRPVANGGRYNNLTSSFGGAEPAVGFSIEIDSIVKHCRNPQIVDPSDNRKKISVPLADNSVQACLKAIKESREIRKKVGTAVIGL